MASSGEQGKEYRFAKFMIEEVAAGDRERLRRMAAAASHLEAREAARMTLDGIDYAVLVINNPKGICAPCHRAVPLVLRQGYTLVVWAPADRSPTIVLEKPDNGEIEFNVEYELPEQVEKFDEDGNEYFGPNIEGRQLTIRFQPDGRGTAVYWRNRDQEYEQFSAGPYPLDRLVSIIRQFLESEGARPESIHWRPGPLPVWNSG